MITYTTKIIDIEVTKDTDGLTDVVYNFTFKIIGEKDGIIKEIKHTMYHLSYNKTTFTEFESLTEQQIISWIPSALLEKIKQKVEILIDEEINSPITKKQLPWMN